MPSKLHELAVYFIQERGKNGKSETGPFVSIHFMEETVEIAG
jgi:hypothetical protein